MHVVHNVHHAAAEMFASTLPLELWFIIFDSATFVPHCFDATVPDPFDHPRRLGADDYTFMLDLRGDLRAIRRALRTKRAISRVCKTWHHLVMPLLYEAVSVVRDSDISPLAQQLKPTLDLRLGAYTRRLDITLPNPSIGHETVLQELICQLPNLEVFVLRPRSNGHRRMTLRLLAALAATCIGTLRKLIWTMGTEVERVAVYGLEHIYNLVDNASRLRTLLLPPILVSKAREYLVLTEVQTHTARLFTSLVADSQGDVHLIGDHPGYAYVPMPSGHPTLAGDTAYVPYPLFFRSEYIERLPEIRKVVLYTRHRWDFEDHVTTTESRLILPKEVTHIGLHFGFTQAPNSVYRAVRKFLGDVTTMGYHPQVVRLLDEKIVGDLTRKHKAELRRMVEEERPFRVEDHLGQPLRIAD